MQAPGGVDPIALVHALPFPALLILADGTLAAVNSAGSTLFEIDPADCGVPASKLRIMRRVPGLPESIAVAQHGGRSIPLPVQVARRGRGRRHVRLIVTPVGSPSSDRAAVLVVAEDVATRGPDGEAETRETSEPGSLAVLAHELRNPLGALVSALHIVGQRLGDDRLAGRAWAVAVRQVRHQARLLDNVLDASRIEVGKLELKLEPVDLVGVVRETVESARLIARASAQDLVLNLTAETIMVRGDRLRLEQIMRNVLDNALKYTGPAGRIDVEASSDGVAAVVRVKDNGIGIDASTLGEIFETFVQADVSSAAARGGLGLGLGLVRALVEKHGGTVEARSGGLGRGTEFEIRIPVDVAGVPAPAVPPTATPVRARHILVIEDDRDAREILQLVLELEGHRVETAADGATGIRIAAATAPDTVLIDIGLPGMDGYEVARRIRRRLGNATRLVALTGYGDAEARRRIHEAGFDAHLVKPVMPEDFGRLLGG